MLDDLRLAFRRLRHRKGFAAAAVLALALGIGCTTAVFTVLQAVLLRALPVPEPEKLVSILQDEPDLPHAPISGPDLRDLRHQARAFESLSAVSSMSMRLTGLDRTEVVIGVQTDGEFFRALRAMPLVGRLYGPGSSGEVVLSESLWRRMFGGDAHAIGRTLSINGEPRTIVGVLPAGSEVPAQRDLWASSLRDLPVLPGFLEGLTMRDARYLEAMARLRPGVSLAQAQAELDAISSRLGDLHPATDKGYRFVAGPLQARIVGNTREPLLLLLGGVLLVLLIACANVAGLQLARGAAAERDFAIRAALGASRGRLVRQLLVESVVLAGCGGFLGVLASWWGLKLLVGLAGTSLPRGSEVALDLPVLLFAVALSVAVGVASGLAPSLLASRAGSLMALRASGATPGQRQARLRGALVSFEVALSVMLLAGAALLIRSFERLRAVDPGFRPEGVVTLPLSHAEEGAVAFHAEIAKAVAALPGVVASGAVLNLPLGGGNMSGDVTLEGRVPRAGDFIAGIQVVAGDYFHAMRIPILRGRALSDADTRSSQKVAVVSETFARRFFPGQDPIGKRFCYGVPESGARDWITIVGISGDVRQLNLAQDPQAAAYYPIDQAPTPPVEMTVVARTDIGVPAFVRALKAEIAPLAPDQPLERARPLEETVAATLRQRQLSMVLLSLFSASALLLAVLGIYATLAYSVAQRTREIGVRMALGARASGVVRLIVLQGMRLALLGAGLGIAGALALGRSLSGLLFGVGAHDPATLAAAALLLLAAAFLACWIPARRAARVDPLVALRAE
jgi:putative ABC transport system permease protein